MPLKLVVDAVEGHLAAHWDATARCPVLGVNANQKPPAAGTAHLVVQYPVANGSRVTFGAPGQNIYREEGVVRLVLNMPKGGGQALGLEWADELAALFRGKRLATVQCFAPSSPALDDRNEAGNFWSLSIAIPYQADVVG